MQIRTVTEADLEPYWALRLQALRDSPEAFGSVYEEQARRPLTEIRQRLKTQCSPENFILVAIVDGLFAGMTGLFRHDSAKVRHKADIWGVYVIPEKRGLGLGRQLVATAIARARQLPGIEQVRLTVVTTNTAARRLYLSLGFVTYGLEHHALKLGDVYLDEEHMVLFLHPPAG